MHLTTAPPRGTTKYDLTTTPPRGTTKYDLTTTPPQGATKHALTTVPPRGATMNFTTVPPRGTTMHDLTTAPPPRAVVISTTASPQGTTVITTVPYHRDHLDPATLGSHCDLGGGVTSIPTSRGCPLWAIPAVTITAPHKDPSDLHSCATSKALTTEIPFALSTWPLHGGHQHLH